MTKIDLNKKLEAFLSKEKTAGKSWYVGYLPDHSMEPFRSVLKPTQKSHGKYTSVTGPFSSQEAANVFATSPEPITMDMAENIVKHTVDNVVYETLPTKDNSVVHSETFPMKGGANVKKSLKKKAQEELPELPGEEEGKEPEAEEEVAIEAPAEGAPAGVEEKLDEVNEKLDTVVDALEEQKEVLEEVVGEEVEENFEEMELKDITEDEEMTPEEFGLDTDSLSARKEKHMALKQKRAETLGEEWKSEESGNKKFKPVQPEVPSTKVKKDEVPSMFKLANVVLELNDAKNRWTVLHGSTKICTIACKSPQQATPSFARKVILAMRDMGVVKALKKFNAKRIKADEAIILEEPKLEDVIPEVKVEDKKDEVKVEVTVSPVASIQDNKRRFARAFRLAIVAQHKNLIGDNPLKASFFETLTAYGLGADVAAKIIEASFAAGAIPQFELAMNQADKYLSLSDEAFVETESTIGDMNVKPISVDASEDDVANELKLRAARSSLPVVSASEDEPEDKMAKLASALPKPRLAGIAKLLNK